MKLMNQLLVMMFCFMVMFAPFSYATSSDPCENIQGNWKGTIKSPYCVWDVEGNFMRYESTIRFSVHGFNGRGSSDCRTIEDILSGTCKDALINLKDGTTGTIFGDSIILKTLRNNLVIELKKVVA